MKFAILYILTITCLSLPVMAQQRIYCISGLGADHRIFTKLKIEGVELIPVPWPPIADGETMATYAAKVSAQIPDSNPVILGVSFGGMLAVDIAAMRPVGKVFIVSSAKCSQEMTPPGAFWRFLVNNRLLPVGITKVRSNQTFKRFGATTDEEKDLLMSILRSTDNKFTKWALKAMLDWPRSTYASNIVHLHGTADKMILPGNVHPDYWIDGGEHFMIYSRAQEISAIMSKVLFNK